MAGGLSCVGWPGCDGKGASALLLLGIPACCVLSSSDMPISVAGVAGAGCAGVPAGVVPVCGKATVCVSPTGWELPPRAVAGRVPDVESEEEVAHLNCKIGRSDPVLWSTSWRG